jgi:hypothetical protein
LKQPGRNHLQQRHQQRRQNRQKHAGTVGSKERQSAAKRTHGTSVSQLNDAFLLNPNPPPKRMLIKT